MFFAILLPLLNGCLQYLFQTSSLLIHFWELGNVRENNLIIIVFVESFKESGHFYKAITESNSSAYEYNE